MRGRKQPANRAQPSRAPAVKRRSCASHPLPTGLRFGAVAPVRAAGIMDARGAIAPARHEGAAPKHMTRSSTMPASDPGMTFPRLLMKHAAERGGDPATREKDLGIWQTWTWGEVAAEVRALACGLAAQGFKRGMHLAIIGDNRPRLYWSMTAAQALGGVPVPMYQDAPAAEFVYVLNDAEIAYAVVEDQEQVDKMQESLPQVPTLKHVYYDDPRGLRNYEVVTSFDRLLAIGREFDRAHPGFFDAEVAKGQPGDVSIMLYTSGTTGKPKGVCQTHRAFIDAAEGGCSFDNLRPDDSILSYLPMAWVGDHLFSYAQWLVAGFTVNC